MNRAMIVLLAALLSVGAALAVEGEMQIEVAGTLAQEDVIADHWQDRYGAVVTGNWTWDRCGFRVGVLLTFDSPGSVGAEGGVTIPAGDRVIGYIGAGSQRIEVAPDERERRTLYRGGVYVRIATLDDARILIGGGIRYLDRPAGADLAPWLSIGWMGR